MERTFVPIDCQPPSHNFRGLDDELFVDIASEPVPGVPPHLWCSSESIIVSNHRPRNQKQQAQIIDSRAIQLHGERCQVCGGPVGNQGAETVVLFLYRWLTHQSALMTVREQGSSHGSPRGNDESYRLFICPCGFGARCQEFA